MKSIIKNLFLITIFMLFPVSVLATGDISASPSSLTIEVGSTKTFTITATNTIGDVSISSSNTAIAKVNSSEWVTGMCDEGQTESGTITVTGISEGTATITLTLDAATFDGEDLAGQIRTITVNVVPKATPNNNNSNNNNSNNNVNNNSGNSNNNTQNKSTNNKIKEISVDGYKLVKVDDNNYTLTVPNNINNVNINATAEDSKSKVSGTGNHQLNIGENNIEVIITSESGAQNKITIKITRKDAYYLEDLDIALNNPDLNDINININLDSKLSSQDLTKLKNSRKIIKFNYYDENKELIYSWILDGSQINDFDELIMGISFESENSKEISKLSNYADGLYVNIKHKGNLPAGTKLKLYVGNKYYDEDKVNIYYYNNDKELDNINEGLTVKNGFIEFATNKGSDYFVTMSKISNSNEIATSSNKSSSIIIPIVIAIIILLVIVIIIVYISKKKKTNNTEKIDTNVNIDYNNIRDNNNLY